MAAIAVVFCFVNSAKAQTPNLSANDTVTYINTTLHKYPALEFVASGCPGYEQSLSISDDRRSLIIIQNFGQAAVGTCNDVQTLIVPIFSLDREGIGVWNKQGQHSSFLVNCVNSTGCFSRRSPAFTFPFTENTWRLRLTAPDRISDQLKRAIEHLVDSLLAEANDHIDNNDPFAKRTH